VKHLIKLRFYKVSSGCLEIIINFIYHLTQVYFMLYPLCVLTYRNLYTFNSSFYISIQMLTRVYLFLILIVLKMSRKGKKRSVLLVLNICCLKW